MNKKQIKPLIFLVLFFLSLFVCMKDSLAHNKFIFIHHSTGGYWIANTSINGGGLGKALDDVGIYVRNIGYDIDNNVFDPPQNSSIANTTDIGHWWLWFADTTLQSNSVSRRDNILDGLNGVYNTTNKNTSRGSYTTNMADPGGENDIIMIKSCYPSANVYTDNGTTFMQMRGQASNYTVGGLNVNTVTNTKALYKSLLDYFKTRTDKIFIISFTPPLLEVSTTQERADNARSVANWLVNEWLQEENWENKNVYVFDQFNVLTHANNRHTYSGGQVVHYTDPASGNFLVYPRSSSDNHPSGVGHQKATADFVPLLQHWIATYEEFILTASDTIPPSLSSISSISLTRDPTPSFTFTSDEAGTISYGGSCSSSDTSAISGENTITLNALARAATYSDCTVTVTDSSDNASAPLSIPSFSVTYQGDLDLDKDVDIFDYNTLVSNFGQSFENDCDGDGDMDIFDYNLLLSDFGRSF